MAKSKSRSSWSRKRKASRKFVTGLVLGLLCIVAVVSLFAFAMHRQSATSADDASSSTAFSELPAAPEAKPAAPVEVVQVHSLEDIVSRHRAAAKIDQITTMKTKARLEMGSGNPQESTHEVTLYFRRPNLARRILEHDGLRFDMGFDGEEIWAQQVGHNGVTRPFDDLTEAHKKQFKDSANIGSYLWRFADEPTNFKRLADASFDGTACYVVRYENPNERVTTYIDAETFYEIGRVETSLGADGQTITMQLSDHRNFNGVVMPCQIKSEDGNGWSSDAVIEDVTINTGLPSYIFDAPQKRYTAK